MHGHTFFNLPLCLSSPMFFFSSLTALVKESIYLPILNQECESKDKKLFNGDQILLSHLSQSVYLRLPEEKELKMSDNIVNGMSKLKLNLKETLECPVCLKLPQQIPIYQCNNGHIICKSCHSQLETCPLCRESLGANRSLVAERLLEAFPEPCKFARHGCDSIVVPYNAEDHAKECAFREVECPIDSCDQKIIITKMNDHIKNDHHHGMDLFVSTETGKFTGDLILSPYSVWSPDLISFSNMMFLHMLKKGPSNSRHLWVYGIGSEREMSKFTFTLRLYHPDVDNEIICKGRVTSIDCPQEEVVASKQSIFLAENSLLWVAEDELLNYDIEIAELPQVGRQH